jgi:hypothetical protein
VTDCELPAFYRHSERIARKQHRCCECSATSKRRREDSDHDILGMGRRWVRRHIH